LLADAATIFIHQGIIRMLRSDASSTPIGPAATLTPMGTPKGARRGVAYLILGSFELLAALHMDFLVNSYLEKHYIIWAILGLWLAMLIIHQFLPRKPDFEIETIGRIALVFAALTLAHIFYHRPWGPIGLWAMALAGILAALNPIRSAAVSDCPVRGAPSRRKRRLHLRFPSQRSSAAGNCLSPSDGERISRTSSRIESMKPESVVFLPLLHWRRGLGRGGPYALRSEVHGGGWVRG